MILIDYCALCGFKHLNFKSYCMICKCCTFNKTCMNCKNEKIKNVITKCDTINNLINIKIEKYKKNQSSDKLHVIENNNIYIIYTDYEKKLNDDYELILNHLNVCRKKSCHNLKYELLKIEDQNKKNKDLINKKLLSTHINKINKLIKTIL